MSYVLSLVVAATVLGATQASSEECLGESVRWVDNGVTVGTSLNNRNEAESTAVIKEEEESEPPEMIAIIESNREDRERKVVMDR